MPAARLFHRLLTAAFRPHAPSARRVGPLGHALERLEDRVTPATFTEAGVNLNLNLLAGEQVSVVANAGTYKLTLTGGSWTGTNSANVTGTGTAAPTVTSAGIAVFTGVAITDGGSGAGVAFNDSGANGYSEAFTVTLDNGSNGVRFHGASSFGAQNLTVNTDRGIAVGTGAAVTASNGTITLNANLQATPTAGAFDGVAILGAVLTSGTGNIVIAGRGGDDAATAFHQGVTPDRRSGQVARDRHGLDHRDRRAGRRQSGRHQFRGERRGLHGPRVVRGR